MLIVFEGPDGAGKTTQAKFLQGYLETKGKTVCFLREPGGDNVSEQIRSILLNKHNHICDMTEALLYAASRNQFIETVLKPSLQYYDYVILDRYWYSSIAYQAYGRQLGLDKVKPLIDLLQPPVPDFVIYLSISYGEMLRRKHGSELDRLEREEGEFWERVLHGYTDLFEDIGIQDNILRTSSEGAEVETTFNRIRNWLRGQEVEDCDE